MHPMELLDGEAKVEACFGPFGDSANLDERYVHGLRRTYYGLRNRFRCTRCCSKVMMLRRKLILVCLEIVLILTQDRCTDCAEHTIGSEIVLDAPDETHRCHESCGISFRSIWRQHYCRCKIGARFAPKYHRLRNRFGCTRWYS
jgi:hypothetical protein